ncbi:MAG: hypothetical protein IBX57_00655 [Gammaproteobacteria bacterium]|nr:hypothetical protein [Gammaproteobacteria bacterium]
MLKVEITGNIPAVKVLDNFPELSAIHNQIRGLKFPTVNHKTYYFSNWLNLNVITEGGDFGFIYVPLIRLKVIDPRELETLKKSLPSLFNPKSAVRLLSHDELSLVCKSIGRSTAYGKNDISHGGYDITLDTDELKTEKKFRICVFGGDMFGQPIPKEEEDENSVGC